MSIIKEYGKIFLANCYDNRVSSYTFCFEDFVNKEKGFVFINPSLLTHRTSAVVSVNHVCFSLLLLFACLFVCFFYCDIYGLKPKKSCFKSVK